MKTRLGNKVYPLSAAQRLQVFQTEYCPKKELLNIGASLTIEIEIDKDLLREAIAEAYARCESMRLRFVKDKDGTVYQYVIKKEEREVPYFDFTGWQEDDAKKEMEDWTSTPFERYDTSLNKVVMIKTPDGFEGIYLCVDHLIMDAQSIILFFRDIIEIYCFKKYPEHEGVAYPKEMESYLKQLKIDLDYSAGSKANLRDREFFTKQIMESEPIFNHFTGKEFLEKQREENKNPKQRAAFYLVEDATSNIINFNLEPEPSFELMRFCEANGVSMQGLVMMGLRTYYQKQNENDDVSILSMVARRATKLEKRCGGSRVHAFPCRTKVSLEETFMDGIMKIRDTQNQMFRHANFSTAEYFGIRSKIYNLKQGQTYEPMGFTYQPMTLDRAGLTKMGDIRYKSARYTNRCCAQALYLTLSHRAIDSGLEFSFEHRPGIVNYEQLEHLYYYVCKILFEAIKDPNKTVGEIIAAV